MELRRATVRNLHSHATAILIAVLLTFAGAAGFAAPPPEFEDELVLGSLDQPVAVGFLPGDGRMLIVHRQGEILIADPQASPVAAAPYLTVPDVESSGERGLFSIAFDPAFSSNGFFYVYYTNAVTARHRIARFTHSGDSASAATETVIWEDAQIWSGIGHIGGGLDFGPDGMLYLATGDENNGSQAQDLTRSGGKVIRIAPDGSIPPDNPLVGGAAQGHDESIWALGLRNPLRLHWDPVLPRLYIGDVGQDTFEEVHVGFSGANFGWPLCEGPCGVAQLADPLFYYLHDAQGGAVVGGFVYRGSAFPVAFQGAYFFADFVQGWIRYLTFDASGNLNGDFVLDPIAGSLVFLDEGPDGALYYIRFSLSSGSSEVRRIRYAPGAPVIEAATADVTSGPGPDLAVNFSGTATDPQMDPLSYRWIFGDGSEASAAFVAHTYVGKGPYTAQLEVSDSSRTTLSDPIQITVGAPPVLAILSPGDQTSFRGGDIVQLSASFSDPDGSLAEQDLLWEVNLIHNEHQHPEAQLVGVATGQFTVPTSDHDFHDETAFDIALSATDSDGLTARVSHVILPEKVGLVFDTVPGGLDLVRDDQRRTAPHPYATLIGFQHLIEAPSPQCLGGVEYVFDSWSDGGGQSHTYVVPETAATVTANFLDGGPCIRVETGQLALYEFAEGSGTTVGDSAAAGSPLDLAVFDPTAVTWLPGGGLSVDSFTQIQSAGAASKLLDGIGASGALTVEAWLRPDDLLLFGPARIVALSEGSTVGSNLVLGQGPSPSESDRYSTRLRTSTTSAFGTPALDGPLHSVIPDLTHVVYTRAASGLAELYLNGTLTASMSVPGNLGGWAATPLTLANDLSGDRGWTGELQLVAFYDRALSALEVARNFRALAPPNSAPVAASDNYQVDRGESLVVSVFSGVLANDSDPDGDPIAAALNSGVANGALTFQPDGSFVYTNDGSQATVDGFTYAADDGMTSSSGSVTIEILDGALSEITVEPVDRVVAVGESAVFGCDSTSGIPTTYAWERDGFPIPGADANTYVTPPATLGDSGSRYRCVAASGGGVSTSREALLQVVESDRVLSGRIVAYDFLEGSGDVVYDVSGTAPPLDLSIEDLGAVRWLEGGGLAIDAITRISSGLPADKIHDSLRFSGEVTVEAWVRTADADQFGPARIVALSQDSSSAGGNFVVGQGSSPSNAASIEARLRTSATNQFGLPSLKSTQGTLGMALSHVLFTRDASGATRLYIDGVQLETGGAAGSFSSWEPSELTLANEATGDRGWLGELRQVVVYDRALSPAEAVQNFAAGPPAPAAGIAAVPVSGWLGIAVLAVALLLVAIRQPRIRARPEGPTASAPGGQRP